MQTAEYREIRLCDTENDIIHEDSYVTRKTLYLNAMLIVYCHI